MEASATKPSAKQPRRRTQAERTASTRAALLDATIDCLVEYGYAHLTTTRVVERAGVSRGAQVHHFPTKAELVSEAGRPLAGKGIEEFLHTLPRPSRRGVKPVSRTRDLTADAHNG